MKKINNQHFVNDLFRDIKYTSTLKCSCCGEESHLSEPSPLVTDFIKWLNDFTKLHKKKGCNKVRVDIQEWEAKEISWGIAI